MKTLLLSLGHGSSAVFVRDNEILCGYENERLTKIKSDSQYPRAAIEEIQKHYDLYDVEHVLISHWFINGKLPDVPNKYYDMFHLKEMCPSAEILSVNQDFTHHDAHAYSAKVFAGPSFTAKQRTLCIVCDGFGTMGETLSIYKVFNGQLHLHHRSFGFSSSLGLLYQYATSYLGMKENQDEYKLLGYEPEAVKILSDKQKMIIDDWIVRESVSQLKNITTYDIKYRYDPVCSVDALPALKHLYRQHFDKLLVALGVPASVSDDHKRAIIAYYVQNRVEYVLSKIVEAYEPKNLLLSGGVFMNVKLNNKLLNTVEGDVCIMPLCGDQGAPIGLFEALYPGYIKWPEHLNWGARVFTYNNFKDIDGLYYFNGTEYKAALKLIADHVNNNGIVNVVKGNMEFGARALCNTSTFALPTKDNVEYINMLNERSTIMPMAPVMSYSKAEMLFDKNELTRVHKSLQYMVCTLTYDTEAIQWYKGAAHNITGTNDYSGRPQITDDTFNLSMLYNIINQVIINTSFNIHGKPIVFDADDVIESHNFQTKRDKDNRVITVVIGE